MGFAGSRVIVPRLSGFCKSTSLLRWAILLGSTYWRHMWWQGQGVVSDSLRQVLYRPRKLMEGTGRDHRR